MTETEELITAIRALRAAEAKLPEAERKRLSLERLVRQGVLTSDGEFTDAYAYSRECERRRRAGDSVAV
ncbi:MAG: hypothetical protein LBK42_11755 [Propionibacteriaceae bacterium]|jgi:hypothetical protein|nr:hypothetical protein [Propionibacteriaceae bacterium]